MASPGQRCDVRTAERRQVVDGYFVSCGMACGRRPVARHQIAYRSVHGSPLNRYRDNEFSMRRVPRIGQRSPRGGRGDLEQTRLLQLEQRALAVDAARVTGELAVAA